MQVLKAANPAIRVVLADAAGSSLGSYVRCGTLDPSPNKTIAEGIGINRVTANFKSAKVDDVVDVADTELVAMAHYLRAREALLLGPSAALNCCAAVKAARMLGPGHTIVTLFCDGGERYASKMYRAEWLEEKGLAAAAAAVDTSRDHCDFVL